MSQPLIITSRERPHEETFHLLAVTLGLMFIIGVRPPNSIEDSIPEIWLWIWYILFFVGGALGISARFRRNLVWELIVERSALIAESGATLIYALVIFSFAGMNAIVAGGLSIAWLVANVRRMLSIQRDLKLLEIGAPDASLGAGRRGINTTVGRHTDRYRKQFDDRLRDHVTDHHEDPATGGEGGRGAEADRERPTSGGRDSGTED